MGFLLSKGFTQIDHATQMQTLMGLPDRCVKAYLFLLSRSTLRPENRSAHWGEIAAAIGKGQTQTFAALKELAALGVIEAHGQMWTMLVAEKKARKATESRRKSPGIPAEIPRKSEMEKSKSAVLEGVEPAPEVREVIEVIEQNKHTSADADKSAEKGKSKAAALFLLSLWNEHRGVLPKAQATEKRLKKLAQIAAALGEDAENIMRAATLEVAGDKFWRDRRYDLDTLLAGEKYISKAETYRSKHPQNLKLHADQPATQEPAPYFDPMEWFESLAAGK